MPKFSNILASFRPMIPISEYIAMYATNPKQKDTTIEVMKYTFFILELPSNIWYLIRTPRAYEMYKTASRNPR